MAPDELRSALAEAGIRRMKAEQDREVAMRDLAALIRQADGQMPVVEIATLARVTRQTVYTLLRD